MSIVISSDHFSFMYYAKDIRQDFTNIYRIVKELEGEQRYAEAIGKIPEEYDAGTFCSAYILKLLEEHLKNIKWVAPCVAYLGLAKRYRIEGIENVFKMYIEETEDNSNGDLAHNVRRWLGHNLSNVVSQEWVVQESLNLSGTVINEGSSAQLVGKN